MDDEVIIIGTLPAGAGLEEVQNMINQYMQDRCGWGDEPPDMEKLMAQWTPEERKFHSQINKLRLAMFHPELLDDSL